MPNIQTTAFGEAIYPYLTSPDTQYNTNGVYQVKLKVTKEEAQTDISIINKLISELVAEQHKKTPGVTALIRRAPVPYTNNEDGTVTFKFKLNATGVNKTTKQPFTQKPNLVDHELNAIPDDKNIYGGSIIRVNYEPIPFNVATTGLGVTLRLKGVQVKQLVQGQSNLGGFEKVEPTVAEGGF